MNPVLIKNLMMMMMMITGPQPVILAFESLYWLSASPWANTAILRPIWLPSDLLSSSSSSSSNFWLTCRYRGNILFRPASVAQLDAPSDWRPGGRGFNPHRGRQHSFVEIDHEIFSMVILFLPLIQEGQLSVPGERMCTILVNHLED